MKTRCEHNYLALEDVSAGGDIHTPKKARYYCDKCEQLIRHRRNVKKDENITDIEHK